MRGEEEISDISAGVLFSHCFFFPVPPKSERFFSHDLGHVGPVLDPILIQVLEL